MIFALEGANLLKKLSLLMIVNFVVLVNTHLVEVVLRGSEFQGKLSSVGVHFQHFVPSVEHSDWSELNPMQIKLKESDKELKPM